MIGHQARILWMGEEVLTLADLWPEPLRAVVAGVNPAPTSVAAGHYYQGTLGKRILGRLRTCGVIPVGSHEYDDDAAVEGGIGFTDVVKRPTPSASDVSPPEFRRGREEFLAKIAERHVPLVIFPFKRAAEAILGRVGGVGFQHDRRLGSAEVFVMPGPFAPREQVDAVMATLADAGRA